MKKINVALICTVVVLAGLLALSVLQNRASRKLLGIIAIAQPGHHIETLIEKYGEPSGRYDDPAMNYIGPRRHSEFTSGKILYQYYVTPNCRIANICTDTNGVIEYVSWKSL